jgi:hypothetical protein
LLFAIGAVRSAPLPGNLPKSKHLLNSLVMAAYSRSGSVLQSVRPRADNTLSWTFDVGYFKLVVGDSGLYDSAQHTPSKVVAKLPMGIQIKQSELRTWAIEDNHIEHEAHLTNPESGLMLKMTMMFGDAIAKPMPFQATWALTRVGGY